MKRTKPPLSQERDRKVLEKRRLKAIKLKQKGWSQYKIANHLGVSFEAVSNWVELYKESGLKGLKSKGHPGPKSQLTAAERKKLKAAILKGPKALGHTTGIWTLERIASLIEDIGGAKFKTTQTWRIVTSLGFSCQKPITRAKERNEAAIKNWKLREFPGLKKMGRQK